MDNTSAMIWTIGHSTHPLDVFVAMLHSFSIELVVDIRSFPGSRRFPQFNKESFELTLPDNNLVYTHIASLGGRRKVDPLSHNTSWHHPAFRGYADYMETADFAQGIQELTTLARVKRTAYMCSESLWWRCHRSMVSDYLQVQGWEVYHIMQVGKETKHTYTQPAKIIDGVLVYGPEAVDDENQQHTSLMVSDEL